MQTKKMAIFDMDGTIIDSVPDITNAVNFALEHFGFPKRTSSEVKSFVGNGARKIVERSVGKELSENKVNEILNFYNDYYTAHCTVDSYIYDGVKEMLNGLKEKGYLLAIITNKPQMTADVIYNFFFKEFEFVKVIGPVNGGSCKPEKQTTVNLLKEFGIENESAYFIGDGDTDAMTALNANINGISVLWGYKSKEDLLKVGAKTFAHSPLDILNLVK